MNYEVGDKLIAHDGQVYRINLIMSYDRALWVDTFIVDSVTGNWEKREYNIPFVIADSLLHVREGL